MANETLISTRQNEPRELRRLSAMRHLYTKAGRLSTGTALTAVALAILGPIAATNYPWTEAWVALVGIVFTPLELLVLKRRETRLKQGAAAIQEQFDCYVLGLPWNPVAVEESPGHETVVADGESRVTTESEDSLRNWYSPDVDNVPAPAARLICQRSNLWWDSDLRKPYAVVLIAGSLLVPSLFVAWALGSGRDVATFIVVLAAALPLVVWAGQEAQRHNEAGERAQRLRSCAEDIWKDMIADVLRRASWDRIDDTRFLIAARSLQDQIYIHRLDTPKVPNWFYKRSRERKERQMIAAVRELIADYERAKGA